jgi:ABC-type polysaccharide/polyol phosphate transport system ATPase subunit
MPPYASTGRGNAYSMVIVSCCSARRHAGSCAPLGSLSIEDLSKNSRGVRAIDSVTLKVVRREVHGLLVQNVSGKPTLIQILSRFHEPDPGPRDEARAAN